MAAESECCEKQNTTSKVAPGYQVVRIGTTKGKKYGNRNLKKISSELVPLGSTS